MKNKMSDVRDHLVAMLESLGDPESSPEVIERAKATALVAGTYINAVKVEIDAIRLADEVGQLPAAIDANGSTHAVHRTSLQLQQSNG